MSIIDENDSKKKSLNQEDVLILAEFRAKKF